MKRARIEVLANAQSVTQASRLLSGMPSPHAVQVRQKTFFGGTRVRLDVDVLYEEGRERDVFTELSGLVKSTFGPIEEVCAHCLQ